MEEQEIKEQAKVIASMCVDFLTDKIDSKLFVSNIELYGNYLNNKSLTPPDAENEAVMFAEWMLEQGCKKWSDDKWEIRKPLNITHTNGTSNYYTTQELFNLYKQGGK